MFLVLKLQPFEFETSNPLAFLGVKVDTGKMAGYLPVYNTSEDALRDFPGAKLAEIKEGGK